MLFRNAAEDEIETVVPLLQNTNTETAEHLAISMIVATLVLAVLSSCSSDDGRSRIGGNAAEETGDALLETALDDVVHSPPQSSESSDETFFVEDETLFVEYAEDGRDVAEPQCVVEDDCEDGWTCIDPPGICVRKSDLDVATSDPEVVEDTHIEPGDCAGGNPTTVGSNDVDSCLVPETSFAMGSPDGECELNGGVCPDEKPQHEVVTLEFYMDRFEITNSQFKVFTIQNPQWAPGGGGPPGVGCDEYYLFDWGSDGVFVPEDAEKPVGWVCWHAARAFCEWAGKALPTEAEWELAAKGSTHRIYPWGDAAPTCEHAAFEECAQLADVGSFEMGESPYGIHDLAGNAAEWVADWYGASYYCDPDASGTPCHEPDGGWIQPQGPNQGIDKVVRGGGAFSSPFWLRASARGHHESEYTGPDVGFRCVYRE